MCAPSDSNCRTNAKPMREVPLVLALDSVASKLYVLPEEETLANRGWFWNSGESSRANVAIACWPDSPVGLRISQFSMTVPALVHRLLLLFPRRDDVVCRPGPSLPARLDQGASPWGSLGQRSPDRRGRCLAQRDYNSILDQGKSIRSPCSQFTRLDGGRRAAVREGTVLPDRGRGRHDPRVLIRRSVADLQARGSREPGYPDRWG